MDETGARLGTPGPKGRVAAVMNRTLIGSIASLFSSSDEQAMWRVQMHDDAQAFARLVHRWEVPIQRLCGRMLGDRHRGQDLAQETFARLFARRKEYQASGRFSTFLWRIAVNLCHDELRRRKRRPEVPWDDQVVAGHDELRCLAAFEPAPDGLVLQREEGEIVRRAVLQLSEAYRSVVVLRHYENLKFREIAEVLGIPEGTVKSRMAEALTQLHAALSRSFTDQESIVCKTQTKRLTEERLML
jgi:RNA polymerase sigma-70 factor, ECF subfamily